MAIVQMQKVAVLAHHSLEEELISLLHEAGVLQITPANDEMEIDHTAAEYEEAEVEFAINTLKKFASPQALNAAGKKATVDDVLHAATHTNVQGILQTLHDLEKSDTDTTRTLQETVEKKVQVAPWRSLSLDTNAAHSTTKVIRLFGVLPTNNVPVWQAKLHQGVKRCVVEIVSTEGSDTHAIATVWQADIERFEEVSTTYGWTTKELPVTKVNPAIAYEELLATERKLQKTLEDNVEKRRRLAVELPNLVKVRQFLTWLEEKRFAREAMAKTQNTTTLLGWLPKKSIPELEAKLSKLSTATAVMKIKPDAGEEPPVLLKNNKFITPFESVTTLYGLPLPSEMDPTAALAPFFALYFGLCLTDAGYGAIIALIFGVFLWKTKQTIQEAPLWWLLFLSGIVTFFVSIPFGGWFGLTVDQVPSFLTYTTDQGQVLFKGQIWNLSSPDGINFLQNLSLVLGITHIFFGIFLAGLHKWVHGSKAEAFWKSFTAHILLGAAIFVAAAPENLSQIATYTLYAALALMVWGQGYGSPLLLRPIMGVLGMVNFAIGLLSNGLSYLRLLALGLVTGAIALAVNQVAIELGGLFPAWIGIPILIVITLVGHTVSIALNTLGSFIHSGRLQFIEFFSQFFEGGGKGFTPFKRSITS